MNLSIPSLISTTTVLLLGATACAGSTPTRTSTATLGCSELPRDNAAMTAFYAPGNAHDATPIRRKAAPGKALLPERTVGAEIHLRAQEGVTREYLQRALACHAATGDAAHPSDPLKPASGNVDGLAVRSTGSGFAVSVTSDAPEAGREIWQRARAISAPGATVTGEQIAQRASSQRL